jgi:hypothetical protein
MAARDNLLVMYITVTLLAVTLQKTNNMRDNHNSIQAKRIIIVLIESVYVSMCVGEGVGGMEECSSPPSASLCTAQNLDLSNAMLKLLLGPAAMT